MALPVYRVIYSPNVAHYAATTCHLAHRSEEERARRYPNRARARGRGEGEREGEEIRIGNR